MATETVFSRAILFPYPTFRQGESPLESENVRFQKRTQPVPAASVNRHDRTAKHCIQGRGSATGHLTDQRDRTDPPPPCFGHKQTNGISRRRRTRHQTTRHDAGRINYQPVNSATQHAGQSLVTHRSVIHAYDMSRSQVSVCGQSGTQRGLQLSRVLL